MRIRIIPLTPPLLLRVIVTLFAVPWRDGHSFDTCAISTVAGSSIRSTGSVLTHSLLLFGFLICGVESNRARL
jgi:hypothetical protein